MGQEPVPAHGIATGKYLVLEIREVHARTYTHGAHVVGPHDRDLSQVC